jgi:hypothetical protein
MAMTAAGAPELVFDFDFQGCQGSEYT